MRDGSAASLDGLLKEIERQEPRLLYVTNPNNPIGYQINNAGLARLLSSAARFHGLVVVDEHIGNFPERFPFRFYATMTILSLFAPFRRPSALPACAWAMSWRGQL